MQEEAKCWRRKLKDMFHVEFAIYTVVWFSAVFYSIYCFASSSSKYFQNYEDEYSDFTNGWQFIARKKDIADYEWQMMKFLIQKLYLWVILSSIVSEVIRMYNLIKILQMWQILLTVLFVAKELGLLPLLIILLQPLGFTMATLCQSKLLIWLGNALALVLISLFKYSCGNEEYLTLFKLNEKTAYITITAIFWMNLRCVSYSVDNIESKERRSTFINFLSYCLYLPTTFCGPFISYRDFVCTYNCKGNFLNRAYTLCLEIIRFLFWLLFAELCVHYIYVNAAAFHPQWVASLDSWSLYGYGYTMGQFFHIKYLVIYGLSISFSKFENVIVPSLPVCIGRVHMYSDMWRYFDNGLYNFLLRYIYIPSIKSKLVNHPLQASLLCFIFVYIWHGVNAYIMIWAVLNYMGIVIETLGKWINEEYMEKSKFYNKLGRKWVRRITCIAASPLLTMSAISNFYFFSGSEIGHIFATRILNDTIWGNAVLLGIMYNSCQVSAELRLTKKFGKNYK